VSLSSRILLHVPFRCFSRGRLTIWGLNLRAKLSARKKFGEEQVHIWRRSYDVPPPGGESLELTAKRTLPYYNEKIAPLVEEGKKVLVAAHGNSLRSIIKQLENLSPEEIVNTELETGVPIVYRLDKEGESVTPAHFSIAAPTCACAFWKNTVLTDLASSLKTPSRQGPLQGDPQAQELDVPILFDLPSKEKVVLPRALSCVGRFARSGKTKLVQKWMPPCGVKLLRRGRRSLLAHERFCTGTREAKAPYIVYQPPQTDQPP
jgi:hypothetical protein